MNAIRPNLKGDCPKDYARCSNMTTPETTICYNTKQTGARELCPITDIKFIESNSAIASSLRQNGTGYTER